MSTVDRGHAAERRWAAKLEEDGRHAFRPRWKLVDVISMKDGEPVYFDEVKTDAGGPFANFKPPRRLALLELARGCGAVARLVWWPKPSAEPVVYTADQWPPSGRVGTT
jgi:Holliday junction resolvase